MMYHWRALTMSAQFKIENVTDSDIDNSKKALVASLKLALVKYLDSDNGGILDGAVEMRDKKGICGDTAKENGYSHVKTLVPVRV